MANGLSSFLNLPSWDGHNLEVEKISRLYDTTTTTYKFWWGLSLLDVVEQGRASVSLNELIVMMLSKAYPPYKTFHFSFGLQDVLPERIDTLERIFESHLPKLCKSLEISTHLNGMPCSLEDLFKLDSLCDWLLPITCISGKKNLTKLYNYYHQLLSHTASTKGSRLRIYLPANPADTNASMHKLEQPQTRVMSDEAHDLMEFFLSELNDFCGDLLKLSIYVPDRFLSPWNGNAKASDLSNNAPYCIMASGSELLDAIESSRDSSATKTATSPILTDVSSINALTSHADELLSCLKGMLPQNAFRKLNLVVFNPLYGGYFRANIMVLRAFSYHRLAEYMEKHNRLMPAIVSKLYAPEEVRNSLKVQHKYFSTYLQEQGPLRSIYDDVHFKAHDRFALDHFLPWSFVHHDMIWNLTPLDDSANSSKSNNLPPLECIERLAKQHQELLRFHFNRANSENDSPEADDKSDGGAMLVASDNNLGSDFKLIVDHYLEISHGKSINDLTKLSDSDFCDLIGNEIRPSYQVAINQGFSRWNTIII
ncbi:HNH endonuclease domain-containing protein [uncultured Anaerobiospirillum sp.]|uniref:HNH endonuclease domain-containing protein n=1 Tax=uncultured Anaerobiospirillum sp. TaxID=265728 RepID=UPI002803EC2A|nr:HNH endonuclease domain-containing protein [uncultured Anaerobiospirillum sp.]